MGIRELYMCSVVRDDPIHYTPPQLDTHCNVTTQTVCVEVAPALASFLDSTDVLYVVLSPQKAPEEVVTDGYEGAIYVQCGQR